MKITLIGASGFVGTRLITLLKKAQTYEMLNIDLQQSRFTGTARAYDTDNFSFIDFQINAFQHL